MSANILNFSWKPLKPSLPPVITSSKASKTPFFFVTSLNFLTNSTSLGFGLEPCMGSHNTAANSSLFSTIISNAASLLWGKRVMSPNNSSGEPEDLKLAFG